MQHEETGVKPQEEKGLTGMSVLVFAALLAVTANGLWWSTAQADVAKETDYTVKLRSVMGAREIPVNQETGKLKAGGDQASKQVPIPKPAVTAQQPLPPAAPEQAKPVSAVPKAENTWEWRWRGRTMTVEQAILNSEQHKPVQEWAKANKVVLKVKLDPAEELIGIEGNFVYDGKAAQGVVKTTLNPGGEPGEYLVSIFGQSPEVQPEKIAFTIREMLVRSSKPAAYQVDWKKYRLATKDGDGRTLVNLDEQQPHKVHDAELRLTHLYYGNSLLYLSVELPPKLKAPYMFPVAVDQQGLTITNEKGEVSPSVLVQSGVPVTEGVTATTIELGRNNFTDSAALLNIQVVKISNKLVIGEDVPIK